MVCASYANKTGKVKERTPGEPNTILADTDTSRVSVSRTATSKGWPVKEVRPGGAGCRLILEKGKRDYYMKNNQAPILCLLQN